MSEQLEPFAPFDLSACRLVITLEATEAIALERYAGSSLRGALYEALLRRFCMNREASSCAECPLNGTCPVAGLVAPLRDEHPRGRDAPRPFVIAAEAMLGDAGGNEGGENGAALPAARQEMRLEGGERFSFRVTLMGRARSFFPYVALSLASLEKLGIGRPLREHQGQRGRPRLVRVEAEQPFTGEREVVYEAGERAARTPSLVVTPEMVAARAAALPTDQLTLRFTTPMRLVSEGRLLRRPEARPLALRLVERLEALEETYGGGDAAGTAEWGESALDAQMAHARRRERYHAVERLVEEARVTRDETRWVDVTSHSARQQRSMPIGGFMGEAMIEGDLAPLRELLVWGEVAHAGKNAVKGDGCFQVSRAAASGEGAVGNEAEVAFADALTQ